MCRNMLRKSKLILSSKISNLVQLLVSIISLFPKIFADFLWLLLKRRHLKNLKKSANKFKENEKFNIIIKTKYQNRSFERRICGQIQYLQIFKKFNMSQMNPKKSFSQNCILNSTTLHSRPLPLSKRFPQKVLSHRILRLSDNGIPSQKELSTRLEL